MMARMRFPLNLQGFVEVQMSQSAQRPSLAPNSMAQTTGDALSWRSRGFGTPPGRHLPPYDAGTAASMRLRADHRSAEGGLCSSVQAGPSTKYESILHPGAHEDPH